MTMEKKDGKVIEEFQNFAITVTLRPEFAVGSIITQLYHTYREIQRIINRYIEHMGFEIYPEINSNMGLHYHGTLFMAKTSDVVRRKHLFTNNIGYSCVKPCDNYPKWQEYCTENQALMEQIFKPCKFPLTHKQILTLESGDNTQFSIEAFIEEHTRKLSDEIIEEKPQIDINTDGRYTYH